MSNKLASRSTYLYICDHSGGQRFLSDVRKGDVIIIFIFPPIYFSMLRIYIYIYIFSHELLLKLHELIELGDLRGEL